MTFSECLNTNNIRIDSMAHPAWKNHNVYAFYPDSIRKPLPVVLFCHGIGADKPQIYGHLISTIVKCGWVVIYSPYKASVAFSKPSACYRIIWSGISGGVTRWRSLIDTSRIGFIGHSYGGGAIPSLAYKALFENHWGAKSSFLFSMAPWYSHDITQEQLKSISGTTRLVIQIYEDERINDPRMALDIFTNIGIPAGHKWLTLLSHDTKMEKTFDIGHTTPEGNCESDMSVDDCDVFGIDPIVKALTSFASSKDTSAIEMELGSTTSPYQNQIIHEGAEKQRETVKRISSIPLSPEICYVNFWHHAMNPRALTKSSNEYKNTYSTASTPTTLSNYAWLIFYPSILKAQQEELDENINECEEDLEVRNSSAYGEMVENRLNHHTIGPQPPISGYGAKGQFGVVLRFIPNSGDGNRKIYFLVPQGGTPPYPVILFAPEFNISARKYRELLFHMASKGCVVIASSDKHALFTNPQERNKAMLQGFNLGLEMINGLIDTSKIGFVGHGNGVSTLLSMTQECMTEKNWGEKGTFLFLMAPGNISSASLSQLHILPSHTKLILQQYDDSRENNRRIAVELFYNNNLALSQKTFMKVHSYTNGSLEIEADRKSPQCEELIDDDMNCVDDYAIFRTFDLLSAETFDNNNFSKTESLFRDTSYEITIPYGDTMWKAVSCSNNPKVLKRP